MKKTIITLMSIALIACESIDKPAVNLLEVGYNNSKTVIPGNSLHIDAELIAEGKIASVRLVIHPEGEDHSQQPHDDEWELDTLFTGVYMNVRNTNFHEDIPIPASAGTGKYHLDLILTDQEGYQADAETVIELVAPAAIPLQQN